MAVGIIPARGGSKGIPRKNIKNICGKPLIAWTIEAALKSKTLNRVIVSTEDEEIASVSCHYGAEVYARPAELATDEATTLSVLQNMIQKIDDDIIVLLQATSPVRDRDLIDKCVETFIEKNADSLATGFICKFMEYGSYTQRRQDLEGFFYDDGNVYVFRKDIIEEGDRYGRNMERMCISREQNVEIDDEFDFWIAEQILLKRIKEGVL